MVLGFGRKRCPACGAAMEMEITSHRAATAEGQTVVYRNVRRYQCPEGCRTALFDFRAATLDADGEVRGFRFSLSRPAGPPAFLVALGRVNLAYILTVVGLILAYVLFAVGIAIIPGGALGKMILATALTAAALYVLLYASPAVGNWADDPLRQPTGRLDPPALRKVQRTRIDQS